MWRYLLLFLAALALAAGCAGMGASTPLISLELPVGCKLGNRCFILQYPDRDPGPGAVDYGCGRMTYDTHKGTDFAVSDEFLMAQGVSVIASAPGKVLRVRDGVADRLVKTQEDKATVEGSECGNGVVVDHGNGWETQYCHLRQGSVSVRPNQQVQAGERLGLVGASGLASFPHVHVTVRHQGKVVDPAVGVTEETGCKVSPKSLWAEDLPYKPTGLIRSGVSSKPPTIDGLWAGEFQPLQLSSRSEALVFWVHVYGLLEGDQESFEIRDPQGNVLIADERTSDRPNRVSMGFVGKRFEPGTISPGKWNGLYQLTRNEETLVSVSQSFEVTVQ
ncbi:MAG: M23 family metallopeptidase [Cyanobacteria bacterium P01_F01_bin.42]